MTGTDRNRPEFDPIRNEGHSFPVSSQIRHIAVNSSLLQLLATSFLFGSFSPPIHQHHNRISLCATKPWRVEMGSLGTAIYAVGSWIRGTGRARDRLASQLQGGHYIEEHRTGCRRFLTISAMQKPAAEADDAIYVKKPVAAAMTRDESSVAMTMLFMTGSIVGKRFYGAATTREADDRNGWTVMLDYRTLKTPAKRLLKLPTLALAKAIAAEWEYQQTDGIRPFTMPLMKLACTAMERVPLTRAKIIDNLMKKFHQDLVFCRSPGDNDLTRGVLDEQQEKIDPILDWVKSEFGIEPVVYTSFFGGKQEEGLTKAVENVLKKTNDYELAAIDSMAAAAHSLVIPLALFQGRLGIEEAIELIRLEEDLQVDRWGLVEGGHDVDIADLKVQISSAVVFLRLSRIL